MGGADLKHPRLPGEATYVVACATPKRLREVPTLAHMFPVSENEDMAAPRYGGGEGFIVIY